jgi:hypothetical protein
MTKTLKTLAVAAALCAGASGAAMAQTYSCPIGYVFMNGICQPTASPAGVVGAAVDTAGAIAAGTVGAVTGAVPPPPAYYGSSYPPPYATYPTYGGGTYPDYATTGYPAPPQPGTACRYGYYQSSGGCFPK